MDLVLPDGDLTPSIDRVVETYMEWLDVKAPDQVVAFIDRLSDVPEAARAEAVTFNMLRQRGLRPRPGEVLGIGGVDFLCEPERKDHIVVEVTTLLTENVTRASGLAHPMRTDGAFGFGQITTQLMREAIQKAPQMADYPMPRVLVLATEHDGADLLMNAHSASELLTGTTAFRLRIGDVEAKPEVITTLKNSVFFRAANDKPEIEPARRSISAILLMSINSETGHIIGILHPDPARPLDPDTFEGVHFARLREWPITPGGRFGIEWVGPAPSPKAFMHFPIKLGDDELRQIG
jgi:hypothetical protein